MIKIVLSLLLCVVSGLQAKVTIEKSTNGTSYQFSIDGVITKHIKREGINFVSPRLQGVDGYIGVAGKLGNPELPVIRFIVNGLPQDIAVSWRGEGKSIKGLKSPLYPVQPSFSKNALKRPALVYNRNAKSIKQGEFFKLTAIGSLNGIPRTLITLYPFRYNMKSLSYGLIPSFTVKVQARKVAQKVGDEAILFVVGKAFMSSKALAEYKAFKEQMGFRVLTLEVNRHNDDPELLRADIQKVYKQEGINLKYILIIGDSGDVPGEKAKFIIGTTDNYYRSIDTSDYVSDINSPDVGVGRITIKNKAQLAKVLEKLMTYQKGNFSDESWLDRIAFIATNDRYKVAEGSHNYAIDNYTAPDNYIGHYPEQNQLGGDKLYAITHHASSTNVVDAMKDGRFIVNYSGHGSVKTWAGPRVTQRNVRSLKHSDARPFVISNACITGQFTRKESFAETWIRHPQGAIMMWASMDSTYWDEDDLLERAMYDAIFKLKLENFNKITQYALDKVFVHYGPERKGNYYWETYHTFGDPSLRLRDGRTVTVAIEGALTAQVGSKSHSLVIKNSEGQPIENARVALVGEGSKGKLFTSAYSNKSGEVQLDLSKFTTKMNLTLSVYGHNTKLLFTNFALVQ